MLYKNKAYAFAMIPPNSPIMLLNCLDVSFSRYVDDHRVCCYFEDLQECISLEPQSPLFNCGSLMQNSFLRVSIWVLGLSALIGNALVIISRCLTKDTTEKSVIQSWLILNLAISDFIMGIYMVIMGSVDMYFSDEYYNYSEVWRTSSLCRFAGFLSLLSSETSVGFLTVLSVDRFLCICFPFGDIRLTKSSAKLATFSLWLVVTCVSVASVVLADSDSDFYGLSDVCIGLPLITRPSSYTILASDVVGGDSLSSNVFSVPVTNDTKPAWYFSIAIFLGVNSVCFLVVCVCYVAIFVKVKASSRSIRRNKRNNDEIKMAIKMAFIVGTDLFCWMPIIAMGILSQTRILVIPLTAYVWSVVFILPINSSLNPYLYTIATMVSTMVEKRAQATLTDLKLDMKRPKPKTASSNTLSVPIISTVEKVVRGSDNSTQET